MIFFLPFLYDIMNRDSVVFYVKILKIKLLCISCTIIFELSSRIGEGHWLYRNFPLDFQTTG
jgi:hypothetical protein